MLHWRQSSIVAITRRGAAAQFLETATKGARLTEAHLLSNHGNRERCVREKRLGNFYPHLMSQVDEVYAQFEQLALQASQTHTKIVSCILSIHRRSPHQRRYNPRLDAGDDIKPCLAVADNVADIRFDPGMKPIVRAQNRSVKFVCGKINGVLAAAETKFAAEM